ncbi:hypothetical protein BDB01DRAFT_297390 [Pilobolus umbonatus]|nr:hypothetical protein BDB01DRAFT_297390 [Pilobolus umbonatus]
MHKPIIENRLLFNSLVFSFLPSTFFTMLFKHEAFSRRPLEPHHLVYYRGGCFLFLMAVFLAYCSYLIIQVKAKKKRKYLMTPNIVFILYKIYSEQPLLQISSDNKVVDIEAPEIELCVQNSTMTVINCSIVYYNWTTGTIPDCWSKYFEHGVQTDNNKCYLFRVKDDYRMAASENAPIGSIRRFDFYWNIDNLFNLSYTTIAYPSITLTLYHPHFSQWQPSTRGTTPREKATMANIGLGLSRATTMIDHTSSISFHAEKYRAIEPGNVPAILGLEPDYIDIITLPTTQMTWPINPSPNFPPTSIPKDDYQGYFSVQLSQSTIEIKTEIRQHTLINSIALAGGIYGILITIYTLLFGMNRLSPFGIMHRIPLFQSKKIEDKEGDLARINTQNSTEALLKPTWNKPAPAHTDNPLGDIQDRLELEEERSRLLSHRLSQLEVILKEYFIDTDYLYKK